MLSVVYIIEIKYLSIGYSSCSKLNLLLLDTEEVLLFHIISNFEIIMEVFRTQPIVDKKIQVMLKGLKYQ